MESDIKVVESVTKKTRKTKSEETKLEKINAEAEPPKKRGRPKKIVELLPVQYKEEEGFLTKKSRETNLEDPKLEKIFA